MTPSSTLPVPLPEIRLYRGGGPRRDAAAFVLATMLTPSHRHFADRLAESCERAEVPYALYELPAVHTSTSPRGTADLAFTKPNFVHRVLDLHACPVLYVDADFVVHEHPARIAELVAEGCDFAVFNWLAAEHTEAYRPAEITVAVSGRSMRIADRFYRFSHSVDFLAEDQLVCTGGVQLYGPTGPARRLLACWHRIVAAFPDCADDHCLDFAFNNFRDEFPGLRPAWLDQSTARLPYWIYVRPTIAHPEFPRFEREFRELKDPGGRERVYLERARLVDVEYQFPPDCLIDTQERTLLRLQQGRLVPVRRITEDLWL